MSLVVQIRHVPRLFRVRQWVKNAFVFPAPIFGRALLDGREVLQVSAVFAAFCLLSSAVYVGNDLLDVQSDREHPRKRLRPLPSGAVGVGFASAAGSIALLASVGIFAWVGLELLIVAAVYVANNIAYSLWIKRAVLTDVFSIALGFMLRILAGALAADVVPSGWLMICGFSIALFLGFCKRRSELGQALATRGRESMGSTRVVLSNYSVRALDLLIASTATMTVLTYMLFTVAPETIERHSTENLIYSSPLVAYGVFRFALRALDLQGEDAAETLFEDPGFVVTGLLWLVVVVWAL